jgi:hypothetical protein
MCVCCSLGHRSLGLHVASHVQLVPARGGTRPPEKEVEQLQPIEVKAMDLQVWGAEHDKLLAGCI